MFQLPIILLKTDKAQKSVSIEQGHFDKFRFSRNFSEIQDQKIITPLNVTKYERALNHV